MKKALFIVMFAALTNVFAWGGDKGTIHRVWVNAWPNKPNIVCFELKRTDHSIERYGIREDATEENKNRVLSILLAAQTSGLTVQVYYHPDNPNPTGPTLERGNDSFTTRGVQSVSILP